jgi:DNA-binding transcriptional ArsR family regulator
MGAQPGFSGLRRDVVTPLGGVEAGAGPTAGVGLSSIMLQSDPESWVLICIFVFPNLANMNIDALRSRATEASSLMKALANPHRLMILCELHKGERSVGALERAVGLRQSPLSQHLAKLRRDGLVKTRRESQTIYYRLASPKVSEVIALLYRLYCVPDCND